MHSALGTPANAEDSISRVSAGGCVSQCRQFDKTARAPVLKFASALVKTGTARRNREEQMLHIVASDFPWNWPQSAEYIPHED